MLCSTDTLSAKSFRKDHTYSSPPATAVDSAEQGPRVLLQSELPIIHIVFFPPPPPFLLGSYTDTRGAFLPSLSFCPVINGACRGHVAKVRGPQETRSVFGCKNSKASWMHRNAPFTWLCQSWGSVLPSTVGMSIVHTNTSVPAEQHSNVHTVV